MQIVSLQTITNHINYFQCKACEELKDVSEVKLVRQYWFCKDCVTFFAVGENYD